MYVWTDGTDYLAHHGTKGMKWGVRNYQNPDGTLTALGRARLGLKGTYDGAKHAIKNAKAAIKQARIKARRAATLKKARKAKEAKAKAEAEEAARKKAEQDEIEKAVASGDPALIRKYADKMTTEEIRLANNRVDTMKALSDREKASQISSADIAFTKLADLTNKADTGIKFYNRVAALSNTFLGTDLRQIDATLSSEARARAEKVRLDLENAYIENAKKKEDLRKTSNDADKTAYEIKRENEKHIEKMKQEEEATAKSIENTKQERINTEQKEYNLSRQKEVNAQKDRENAEDRARTQSVEDTERSRRYANEDENRTWQREDRAIRIANEAEDRRNSLHEKRVEQANAAVDRMIRIGNEAEDRRRQHEREDRMYERITNAAKGSSGSSSSLIAKTLSGKTASESMMEKKVSDALGYSSPSSMKNAEMWINTSWGPVPIDDKYAKIYDSYNKTKNGMGG